MSDDVCPLCEQPYINRLDVDARLATPTIREDYTVCKQIMPNDNEHWYIHRREPRISISKGANRDRQTGVLARLFGWGDGNDG